MIKPVFVVFVFIVVCGAHRNAFDHELYENVLDPVQCDQQLVFLLNNTLGIQFADASGKLPSGILTGHLTDLGNYHQCLRIHENVQNMDIRGKYCTISIPFEQDNPINIPDIEWPEFPNITFPNITVPNITLPETEQNRISYEYARLRTWASAMAGSTEPGKPRTASGTGGNIGFTLAVCIPRVCSTSQAVDFIQSSTGILNLTFSEGYCRLPGDKPYAAADYVAMVIFSLLGLIIIVSTSYDLHQIFFLRRDPSEINQLATSFSVYTNTRRFLTFNKSPGTIECLDGIRTISMMWIVVGHTFLLTMTSPIQNFTDVLEWVEKFSSVWLYSAPISVDTFFLMSGILCVYTTIGKVSQSQFIRSIYLFYLNRLLRMFPLLAAMVLLQASVFHHVSDGPVWTMVADSTEHCRKYWWSTLLHVQNYVNTFEMCLGQTWYLSVDTQLYFIGPIVIYWLFGQKFTALSVLLGGILLSLIPATIYSFYYNFSASLVNFNRVAEFMDYATLYYMNTLCRASPFFVGMLYGYLLHVWKDKRVRIPTYIIGILWSLSFIMMAFCIFSMYPVTQRDHDNQLLDNFLNAYMRAVWATGLGWLIFACATGLGGPINWFLSLPMWKLPSRMSFAIYMTHFSIIMVANGSWVKTNFFTEGETIYRFCSDLFLALVFAFVLCIAVDAPCSTLQKMLLGTKKSSPRKPKPESRASVNGVDKTAL